MRTNPRVLARRHFNHAEEALRKASDAADAIDSSNDDLASLTQTYNDLARRARLSHTVAAAAIVNARSREVDTTTATAPTTPPPAAAAASSVGGGAPDFDASIATAIDVPRVLQQIHAAGLQYRREVGDGLCFFHGCSRAMGGQKTAQHLRSQLCERLRRGINDDGWWYDNGWKLNHAPENQETALQYIANVEQNRTMFGGEFEVQEAAAEFDMRITVWEFDDLARELRQQCQCGAEDAAIEVDLFSHRKAPATTMLVRGEDVFVAVQTANGLIWQPGVVAEDFAGNDDGLSPDAEYTVTLGASTLVVKRFWLHLRRNDAIVYIPYHFASLVLAPPDVLPDNSTAASTAGVDANVAVQQFSVGDKVIYSYNSNFRGASIVSTAEGRYTIKFTNAAIKPSVRPTMLTMRLKMNDDDDTASGSFNNYNALAVQRLPLQARLEFPAYLTHKGGLDNSVLQWMRDPTEVVLQTLARHINENLMRRYAQRKVMYYDGLNRRPFVLSLIHI